jgi:hypothetical protein
MPQPLKIIVCLIALALGVYWGSTRRPRHPVAYPARLSLLTPDSFHSDALRNSQ